MNRLSSPITALAALLVLAPAATFADATLDERVEAATAVLEDLNRIPEQAIPPNLLNRAYAVAVIPNVIKVGFIVGGSYGKGILVVRRDDGSWSNPAFIELKNASIGWQAGAQGSDIVVVFKSQRSIDDMARGKYVIGGSASAAAGPVGRTAAAATDGEFKAEMYTYSRSRGLFAGISLDGGALTFDQEANGSYYGGAARTVSAIFSDGSLAAPETAQTFRQTLASLTPGWDARERARATASEPSAPAEPAEDSGARTYAIEESLPAEPAPETLF